MANEMFIQNPAVNTDPAYGLEARVYSVNYLKALYGRMGSWRMFRNFTAEVANMGQSVTIPSFPKLTALDISETTGAVSGYVNTQITQASVVINANKAVPFSVPLRVIEQAKIDVKSKFADAAAEAVSDAIERSISGLCASISTHYSGSVGSDLSEALLDAAVGHLVGEGVDVTDPKDLVLILPYTQWSVISALRGYEKYRFNPSDGGDATADLTVELPTYKGIPIFFRPTLHTELAVSGGHIGGLFHKDAVGVAIQRMPTLRPAQFIPGTENLELWTSTLYGVNLIKEPISVQLRCK